MNKFSFTYILLGIILFSILPISNAIAHQSDSLLIRVEQTSDKKGKVDLYNELAQLYADTALNKAQQYTQLAHQLAVEIQYPFGKAQSLYYKARSQGLHNQFQASLTSLEEAITIIKEIPQAKEKEAKYLKLKGWVYGKLSDYFTAIKLYTEAFELYDSLKIDKGSASTLLNIGSIHSKVGDRETALEYYQKAKSIQERLGNKVSLIYCYINLGAIQEYREEFRAALRNYKQALKLAEETNSLRMNAYAHENIGNMYQALNELENAVDHYQQAKQINLRLKDELALATGDINMAKIEFLQSKETSSISSVQQAYQTGKKYGVIELQLSGTTTLSDMYTHQGSFEKALNYTLLANQLRDSITNNEIQLNVKSLDFKKQLEAEKRELAQEKKEALFETSLAYQKNIKNLLFICLALFSIGSIFLFRAYKTASKVKEQLAEKNKDLQGYIEKNVELEQFAYIASHDIKAPLRTIASFTGILKNKFYESAGAMEKNCFDFVEKSAKSLNLLVEDLLEFSRSDSKTLHVENLSLKEVLEEVVENLEFSISQSNGKINLINCDYDINADQIKVKQILQNLMSNALKFRAPDRAPILNIKARDDHDFLYISVEDNGIGIPEENFEEVFQKFARLKTKDDYEGSGLGLSIVAKYIKKHGGDIWIERNEIHGVTFSFNIKKDLPLSPQAMPQNENSVKEEKVIQAV